MLTPLIALLVAVVPGGLLGFALPPGRHRWAAWAAAPALTLGLVTLAMAWLPRVGLPDGALAVLVAELLLVGAAVLVSRGVSRRRSDRADGSGPATGRDGRAADSSAPAIGGEGRAPDCSATGIGADTVPGRSGAAPGAGAAHPDGGDGVRGARGTGGGGWKALASRFRVRLVLPRRADLVGLAVPAVISVGYGWLLLGRLVAPPGWDAMNHGYLTRRIIETGSVAMDSACTTGSTDPVASCSFYPLAANVAWAQATELSGGRLSTAMTAWIILVAPLALVAGVYACVRVLGGRPLIAACAATAPVFLGPMWTSVVTGRPPEQAAPAMAGGIALLLALALRSRHPIRLGLLAGLACAGVVMTHTYDVLFLGVLAVGLFLVLPDPLSWRRAGAAVGAIGVAGIVSLAPLLGSLLGAGGERGAEPPILVGEVGKAVEYWITDPQRYVLLGYPGPGGMDFQLGVLTIRIGLWVTVACLLAAPLCLVLRRVRWARPWLLAAGVFTAIGIWTVSSNSRPASILAGLWYGDPERVRSMIFPVYGVLTMAGAIVLGSGAQWLLVRLVGRVRGLRDSTVPAAVAASVVMLSLSALAAAPSTWRPLRAEMTTRAPVGDAYTRAFEWLAEHTPRGKVVAHDRNRQFMSWSYADYGTWTLFGIAPVEGVHRGNFEQRWRAWHWLVNNKGAPDAGCEVRRLGVEYVVVGGREYPNWDANYSGGRLDDSDRVRRVYRDGEIRIFQVTDAGRACSSSGG